MYYKDGLPYIRVIGAGIGRPPAEDIKIKLRWDSDTGQESGSTHPDDKEISLNHDGKSQKDDERG